MIGLHGNDEPPLPSDGKKSFMCGLTRLSGNTFRILVSGPLFSSRYANFPGEEDCLTIRVYHSCHVVPYGAGRPCEIVCNHACERHITFSGIHE